MAKKRATTKKTKVEKIEKKPDSAVLTVTTDVNDAIVTQDPTPTTNPEPSISTNPEPSISTNLTPTPSISNEPEPTIGTGEPPEPTKEAKLLSAKAKKYKVRYRLTGAIFTMDDYGLKAARVHLFPDDYEFIGEKPDYSTILPPREKSVKEKILG